MSPDRDPAKEVFESLLGRKRDCKTADAKAGKGRGEVESQHTQHADHTADDDECFEDALAKNHERAGASASRIDGAIPEVLH